MGNRAWAWARREADTGRETGKTREASREVTEADRDREHVYHKGGRDTMGRMQEG